DEYLTIITAIHKAEAKSVIEVLESEKANMAEVIDHLLTKSPDVAEQSAFIQQTRQESKLEGKLETARILKAKGIDIGVIAESTGLSAAEIKAL
ncbi:MAG: hypothetical protein ACAI44_39740, partial [Candidatus Sericytochromatia bacterium]